MPVSAHFYNVLLECLQKGNVSSSTNASSTVSNSNGTQEAYRFALGKYYRRANMPDQSLTFFVSDLFSFLSAEKSTASLISLRSLSNSGCPLATLRQLLCAMTDEESCAFKTFSARMIQAAYIYDLQPLVDLYTQQTAQPVPTLASLKRQQSAMNASIAVLPVPHRPSLNLRMARSEVLLGRPDAFYVSSTSSSGGESSSSVSPLSSESEEEEETAAAASDAASLPLLPAPSDRMAQNVSLRVYGTNAERLAAAAPVRKQPCSTVLTRSASNGHSSVSGHESGIHKSDVVCPCPCPCPCGCAGSPLQTILAALRSISGHAV